MIKKGKVMVYDKQMILEILKIHKSYLKQKYSVNRIGLFGSFATDRANKESDLDFYVEFIEKNFDNLAGLYLYLEELFDAKIDIVHYHKNINKLLLENIEKEVVYG